MEVQTYFGAVRFLGIVELINTLEWLHPMELRNSKKSISIQWILGQGALTVRWARNGVTSQAEDVQGWSGMGWGGMHTATRPRANKNLNESPQHLARPLSTGGHTTLPPCGAPTDFV